MSNYVLLRTINPLLNGCLEKSELEEKIKNSFLDYHAPGLDYLCLLRTPYLTVKIYITDPEKISSEFLVNPHDHAYRFDTLILDGWVQNHTFVRRPDSIRQVGPALQPLQVQF